MIYNDFDLWIEERKRDHYPLTARSHANAKGKLRLALHSKDFSDALKKLEEETTNREFSKEFGMDLYRRLFEGEIGSLYSETIGRAIGNHDAGVRIRLRIPPELSFIPWELLHDGKRYLATSTKTPLTRFIELRTDFRDLTVDELPIKVLLVIPEGSGLDTAGEAHWVLKALMELGDAVRCHVLSKKVTRQAISDALRENKYHIFHFIGHGSYSEENEGCLDLNSKNNEIRQIKAESFALFFQDYPATKLVILNSCEGAQVSATKPLAGMVPQIINAGIPAVIAMQYEIPDDVAQLFAREFYGSLCKSADQGRVDVSISYARKRICQEFDESNDFAIPVLSMRSPDGIIFDLVEHQARIASFKQAHTALAVLNARDSNVETLDERLKVAAPEEVQELQQKRQDEKAKTHLIRQKIARWRTLVTVGLCILIAFIVIWTSVFALLDPDDYLETIFVTSIMDPRIDKPFSEDLRLITIQEGANGVFGPFDLNQSNNGPNWRARYAKLIMDLSNAKAKVVVLDVYFIRSDNPTAEETKANQCLETAIRYAAQQGTKVIFGVKTDEKGEMTKSPVEIERALNGSWGDVFNLRPRHFSGILRETQLGKRNPHPAATTCESTESPVLPSLPLQALMQAGGSMQPSAFCSEAEESRTGKWKQPISACLDEGFRGQLNLRDADGQLVKQIPFYTEYARGRAVPMMNKIELADLSHFGPITELVQELYSLPPNANSQPSLEDFCRDSSSVSTENTQLGPDAWKLKNPSLYQGKIVLLGVNRVGECHPDRDIWCVPASDADPRKGKRYGVEIQANVLSNLLTCIYIRPVPLWWSFLMVLAMVALAVLLQTYFRNTWRWTLPFKLPVLDKPVEISFLILAVAIVYAVFYFLTAYIAYKESRLLLNDLHYHLFALLTTYWLVGRVQQRLIATNLKGVS